MEASKRIIFALCLFSALLLPKNLLAQVRFSVAQFQVHVKISKRAQANIQVNLHHPFMPALSWPLPSGARLKEISSPSGDSLRYSLLKRQGKKIVLINSSSATLRYSLPLSPEAKDSLQQIFVPLVKEPGFFAQGELKIETEAGEVKKAKIYLVHGGKILAQKTSANGTEALLQLEPYSILSWEGEGEFFFHLSPFQRTFFFLSKNPNLFALILTLIFSLSSGFFIWFYFRQTKAKGIASPPKTFLAQSYLFYRALSPSAISATLLKWARKGLIVFVEKEGGEIEVGQQKENPSLPLLEKRLWNLIFKSRLKIRQEKLAEEAEQQLVLSELVYLKELT
ncbi:hypothetical protein J7L13_03055, partial [bacterium]|nr:hypothetical protein [bacterium]